MFNVADLLLAITARTLGEWIVFTAAVLGGLALAISVIKRFINRSLSMGRDVKEMVGFARSGDERMERIETQMAGLAATVEKLAAELSQVPTLAQSVASLAETVGAELVKAGEIHDQIVADSLARDEAILERLEAITPPFGNPITE